MDATPNHRWLMLRQSCARYGLPRSLRQFA